MADVKQFKQQSQDIQLDKANETPRIKCKIHQNSQAEMININMNSKNILVCMKCVVFDKLNIDQLVFVDEIFSTNKYQIIKNWPPQQNQELYEKLNSKNVQECQTDRLILQINSYFDKFKSDILLEIDDQYKKIIAHVNSMEDNRQNIIGTYNEISKKEEIRKQLLGNQNNLNQLEEQFKKIILEKQKLFQQDQQRLQNSLDNYQKSLKKLELNYITYNLEYILETIKSIDFLNPLQSSINSQNINQFQTHISIIKQKESSEIQKSNKTVLIKEQFVSFVNMNQIQNDQEIKEESINNKKEEVYEVKEKESNNEKEQGQSVYIKKAKEIASRINVKSSGNPINYDLQTILQILEQSIELDEDKYIQITLENRKKRRTLMKTDLSGYVRTNVDYNYQIENSLEKSIKTISDILGIDYEDFTESLIDLKEKGYYQIINETQISNRFKIIEMVKSTKDLNIDQVKEILMHKNEYIKQNPQVIQKILQMFPQTEDSLDIVSAIIHNYINDCSYNQFGIEQEDLSKALKKQEMINNNEIKNIQEEIKKSLYKVPISHEKISKKN